MSKVSIPAVWAHGKYRDKDHNTWRESSEKGDKKVWYRYNKSKRQSTL